MCIRDRVELPRAGRRPARAAVRVLPLPPAAEWSGERRELVLPPQDGDTVPSAGEPGLVLGSNILSVA
eukprot:799036-Alexandrium_andersonii.AAC.1